jgi:formiminotetrahydrofolate cyclodeaminase
MGAGAPPGPAGPPDPLAAPLGEFLDALASPGPAPGGGGAAALAVALAAGLATMTARLSVRQLTARTADELSGQAGQIMRRAASLIAADGAAYRGVIEASRGPGRPHGPGRPDVPGGPGASARVAAALSAASDIPAEVTGLGADAAALAARLADSGNPSLRGDAIASALLARSGARAAAMLVEINLAGQPGDPRLARCRELAQQADIAARQAEASFPG